MFEMYPPGGGAPGRFPSHAIQQMEKNGWTREAPKLDSPPAEPEKPESPPGDKKTTGKKK